jgi:hypothetical protein
MNVQQIRLHFFNLNQHIKAVWQNLRNESKVRDDQQHVMSNDEMLDEESDESFPASDPPGHISKSSTDKELH